MPTSDIPDRAHGCGIPTMRSRPAAHEADAGPSRFGLISSWSRRPPSQLRHAPAGRPSHPEKIFCAEDDVSLVTCWIIVRDFRLPHWFRRNDHMQSMPKRACVPRLVATVFTRLTFSATCAGGSPHVRYCRRYHGDVRCRRPTIHRNKAADAADCTGGNSRRHPRCGCVCLPH